MSELIEQNQTPEPSEAHSVPAFGSEASTVAAVEVPSYTPRQTFGQLLRGDLGFIPVLVTLILIILFFTIVSKGVFLSTENLSNLLGAQIATFGILGLGEILVLLLGEIDLSIASVA